MVGTGSEEQTPGQATEGPQKEASVESPEVPLDKSPEIVAAELAAFRGQGTGTECDGHPTVKSPHGLQRDNKVTGKGMPPRA